MNAKQRKVQAKHRKRQRRVKEKRREQMMTGAAPRTAVRR